MRLLYFVVKVIWFIAPAGVANMMPVFLKPVFNFLAYPVDFNKTINGEPIFGKNKTWRGVVVAPIVGTLVFWLQKQLFQIHGIPSISFFDYSTAPLWYGTLMGAGAIIGDLIKSFFKRRLRIPPGVSWFPFDQIDYVVGAVLFIAPWYFPGGKRFVEILLVGLVLHVLTNIIGHLIKLRKDWI